jgi:DNA repair ATPase RecN
MASEEGAEGFNESQRSGIERRQSDQDRTLVAMHALETALAAAAPRREEEWSEDVLNALAVLSDVTRQETENASRADSLLADVARTQPRLRNRVRGLRMQYNQLRDAIDSLKSEMESSDAAHRADFADLRQRVAWVLTALRHQRSRESDLIYEAYYEAFRVDLGRDSGT